MTKIKIKPLSINKAWRGGPRYKTNEYKIYAEELFYLLPREIQLYKKNIFVAEVGYSNKRSDIDNFLKAFLDILQKKYKFNDNNIYSLVIEKKIVKKGEEYIDFEILEHGKWRISIWPVLNFIKKVGEDLVQFAENAKIPK